MGKMIVRYAIFAVTVLAIRWVVVLLKDKKNAPERGVDEIDHYDIRIPDIVRAVYGAMFIVGVTMLALFGTLMVIGGHGATIGHLVLAFVVMLIGLLVVYLTSKWKITVDHDTLTLYMAFHKPKTILIHEIDRVEVGSRQQMELYIAGKNVMTIDALSDNAERLRRYFITVGKL